MTIWNADSTKTVLVFPFALGVIVVCSLSQLGAVKSHADEADQLTEIRFEDNVQLDPPRRRFSQPLSDISLDVLRQVDSDPKDVDPEDVFQSENPEADSRMLFGQTSRGYPDSCFHWVASGLFHQPLYFEDIALERHGHARLLQPLVSGLRFYGTVPLLPYLVVMSRPCEHVYVLGHSRPGDCVAPVRERVILRQGILRNP